MSDNKINIGCGFSTTVFIVLTILKLTGLIAISWKWVFAVLLLDLVIVLITGVIFIIILLINEIFKS